jgi:putative ABC transport system permease protein
VDEAVLGAAAARTLGLGPGDTLELKGRRFELVGVYEVPDRFRNTEAIATLGAVQDLAGRPGIVTAAYVEAAPGVDPEALAAAIEADEETLATIAGVDGIEKVDQGMRLMDAANLAISLLAVVIGGIGAMNTMVMSVFERTRELGVLRAVGWCGSRILRLVVAESVALCMLASLVGIGPGVAAAQLVGLVPAVSSFLEPAYPLEVFVRALAVGVAVALAGATYPALRAVRLSPMEALRRE